MSRLTFNGLPSHRIRSARWILMGSWTVLATTFWLWDHSFSTTYWAQALSHSLMWLLGLLAIGLATRWLHNSYKNQEDAMVSLRNSEQRWQFALESSGDGLYDWSIPTNKVHYSRQFKAMLGFDETEMGDSLDEWRSRIHTDDLSAVFHEINRHFANDTCCRVDRFRRERPLPIFRSRIVSGRWGSWCFIAGRFARRR